MAKLAINNGTKLLDTTPRNLPWPPRNEETAEKLKELYMSGQWSFNSPMEQEFENNFAAYHGAKYGIFMANGTTTLECSLAALGVGPGDEVIVPALTWMATALAASYVGAVPVIVDVEPDTLCMDPVQVRKALTPRTKAIIPVHVYGSMANLDELLAVGEEYNLPVVEDCAHMHGGFWRGRGVGSWGKVGSFSFQQSKTLASGEGGICITNDPELAEKIYLLKHIGYARGLKQGQGVKAPDNLLCHNYRGTAFQALILNEQLKTLDERMKIYESNVKYLASLISDIDGVRLQTPGKEATQQGYYSYHLLFDGGEFKEIDRSVINAACAAEGYSIGNGTHGPVYKHALFNLDAAKGQYRIEGSKCGVCEYLCSRALGQSHEALYYRENMDMLSAVLHKIAENIGELKDYAAKKQ
ncbi:MAG: DegT/DnrJ/EryC1/StrS family aminotransferase [Lentisphaeria bacterium]|nr:DegT/DnrJ/EryC1/StrS family aminotransferase [Lentisphaeria bacterium]